MDGYNLTEKSRKVKFEKIATTNSINDIYYYMKSTDERLWAVDNDGNAYAGIRDIEDQLKKENTRLFIYTSDGRDPYAYENKKGVIYRSDSPVNAYNQLPESNFEAKKSPLAEDIVETMPLKTYAKYYEPYKSVSDVISTEEKINAIPRYEKSIDNLEIRKAELEKKMGEFTKKPERKPPVWIPTKPAPFVPKKILPPEKKGMPKVPDMPIKPEVLKQPTPPFEIKDMLPYSMPKKPKKPKDPGPKPKYSSAKNFFKVVFRGEMTDEYKAYLRYGVQKQKYDRAMEKYERDMEVYQEELKKFHSREKEIDEYMKLLYDKRFEYDAYLKEVQEFPKKQAENAKEWLKYEQDMKEYEDKLRVFQDELSAYENSGMQQYQDDFAQYEKDLKAESDRMKDYEKRVKAYEDAIGRQKLQDEEYEKALKKYESNANLKKEYDQVVSKLGNVSANAAKYSKKVQKAKDSFENIKNQYVSQTEKYRNNNKAVENYRSHKEVFLEGIADMRDKGEVTRKGLFANTILWKKACENKHINENGARESLYNYLASKFAEEEISGHTFNHLVSNPSAESVVLSNLNSGLTVEELKNDRKLQIILNEYEEKNAPLNPEKIYNGYKRPNERQAHMMNQLQAKQDAKEMFKEYVVNFGKQVPSEEHFEKMLKYKIVLDYFKEATRKNSALNVQNVKNAKAFLYTPMNQARMNHATQLQSLAKEYKPAFDLFLKNYKTKMSTMEGLPESTKRLMNLKTEYSLPDMLNNVDAIKTLMKQNKLNAGNNALNNQGKPPVLQGQNQTQLNSSHKAPVMGGR